MDERRSGGSPAPVIRLSIGPTGGAKVAGAVLTLVPLFLALFVVGMLTYLFAFATGANDGEVTLGALVCGLLVALSFIGFFGFLELRVLRTAFWLDGTTVVHQRALTTRRVDLAIADVAGDAITVLPAGSGNRQPTVIPAVLARDPRSGTVVKIPLRGQGLRRLPAWELNAIGDAIMSVRQPGDPSYATAEPLVRAIREMAANPFPV